MHEGVRRAPLLSMRTKLPLLLGAVIVAVAVALGWISYREVRRLALASAEARLRTATGEMRTFLAQQRETLNRQVDSVAAHPPLAAALRRGAQPPATSVDRIERWMGTQSTTVSAELWSRSGTRVFTFGDDAPPDVQWSGDVQPGAPPETGISPFVAIRDTVYYQIVRPVLAGTDTVGLFAHTRYLTGSENARAQFRALTGIDARLLVGSPATDIWHDLATVVPAPPYDTRDTGLVTYSLDGTEQLAVAQAIPETPWIVSLEFSHNGVLAGSRAFLTRMLLAGGLVTLLGITGGWIMSRHITVPLDRLTAAVKAFASGNRTARVAIERRDELGDVAHAFNSMAQQVGHQQDELARTNETLSESEERFRLVARGTLDGLWDWQITSGTTFYSPRFRELMDHRVTGDFLETLRTHVHPDDRDAVLDGIARHLEHRDPLDLEARFPTSNGTVRWFRIRGHAVWDDGGRATRLAGSIIDITRRRVAEDEVRDLNTALERRVEERTAALTAANAELEAFTYSVSHDLRAPLRQANGFAQLLVEDFGEQLPEDARHYVQRIRDSAMRMSTLVDDLLRLSRVGRQRLEARRVAVGDIVNTVLAELPDEVAERTMEWKIGPLPTVNCDPTLLKQVFVNLLHNAVKYTRPRDRAVIEVGSTQGAREAVLYVRDNGVGFDPDYADRLFGVFQRLHHSEDFEGSGVGLAIVQRIIHRHGGRVWAESQLDVGATFYVALPIADAGRSVNAPATDT